jgi:4-hydroxybenzoate polyprenyltransferase
MRVTSVSSAAALVAAIRIGASVSRFHIVSIAALGTFTFGWLFTDRYEWGVAAICALDWFVVNLLNRVVDVREDRANAIYGTGFVDRHRRALTAFGFALLVGSLLATQLYLPRLTPLRLAFHLLGLAYNWPLLPGGRRIKQVYFFKNAASGLGFLITVFGYPLTAVGREVMPAGITPVTVFVTVAFFLLFELSYEAIYDLRDAEGDAKAGVRSYAVVHGVRGAVHIIDALLIGSMFVLAVGFAANVVPWRIFVMIAAPLLQLVFYKRALRRGITARDCIALTWLGATLLAVYNLWVWLGLPGIHT